MDADPGSVRLFLPVEAPSEQLFLVKCEVRTDLLAGPMLATVLDDWVEIPSQVKGSSQSPDIAHGMAVHEAGTHYAYEFFGLCLQIILHARCMDDRRISADGERC